MNHQKVALAAGLYLVATPIGTARDITLRALDILASADLLVAEDTRSLKHLMAIHGVPLGERQVWSYHDHSGEASRAGILAEIAAGRSVAYASEAGTPMVSDPGFDLARAVTAAEGLVTTAPGPSAAIAALTLAGQPTDRFLFLGFLSPKSQARRSAVQEVGRVPATLVLYESPKRIQALLGDLCAELGEARPAALCRELTKRFEEVVRGSLGDLRDQLAERTLKGECVLVIGPPLPVEVTEEDMMMALQQELATGTVRDAAAAVAAQFDVPRKQAYQLALKMQAALKDGEGAA
ncbi:16S rRNA (cytidine(1402)-2'-O)-methyltransferase [Pseudoruegeria sp. SK021]|uniref:16S rRNA (cytidine(1402)-2'-O)-methyltransferase n=1 Tax=Pseudoruegeria sp. SK021 TaxID=1933035 RepID=UPI000A253E5F|nr:16S rRNA (cytidine(1402)-2'-O)-methyltransferase [Pseudoruegeria sp. SK021]OSP56069.1 16S rRNA (cytidine(1402)-2'-O)-methyltransferase [Pseudoruegeria sp. SK021]